MWGLITVLNDILVPHLKSLFSLSYAQVMLVQFCFFTAYGIMSIPSAKLVGYISYKRAICLGLLIASIGCLFFLPAAHFGIYPLFLLGLFILATGIVVLQVSANPYVALLGAEKTASARLNLAQGFNSLGTTIGPLIGSYLILSVIAKEQSEVWGVESLYFGLASILLVLAFFIALVKFPTLEKEKVEEFNKDLSRLAAIKEKTPHIKTTSLSFRKFPHLFLGAIAIFCYVGAEVSIGSFLVNFLSQKEVLNVDSYSAGKLVSIYWGLAMVGRFIGFSILLKVSSRKALMVTTFLALLFLCITLFFKGPLIGYSLISIGLFNSIMFPTIFALAIRGLEDFTPQGSGLLCTAIIGGAIIPFIQGVLSDIIGVQYAFVLPLFCYGYIFYYAYQGSITRARKF